MISLDEVCDDATAKAWRNQQWQRPEYVAERLDDLQYEALAGLMRYPELLKHATAHLFSGDDSRIAIFLALRSGEKEPQGIFSAILRRGGRIDTAETIAALYWHPTAKWRAKKSLDQLRALMAWKYKREKKARGHV